MSLCRCEFPDLRYEDRGEGYTPRVAAALAWLRGCHGDSLGDDPADFGGVSAGSLLGRERNRFFRDYDRVASYFLEEGSYPGIAAVAQDWSGDGTRWLTVKSRKVSTFMLLLKLKGVESAVWPWLRWT